MPRRVVVLHRINLPGQRSTAEFLKQQQLTKEKQQVIGALAALGLGLLVLFALNKE